MDWVAIGLSQDLRKGMAMPGRIDDVDLAVWRAVSGQVLVWGDRCPHRGMRLSYGFVRGETLSCIYHGWQYGKDGGCSFIPAHPKLPPPKTIWATTYDCQEGDGLIWVALKDVNTSPPSLSGNNPVRSISIEASVQKTTAHFDEVISNVGPSGATTLVLQPTSSDQCVAHVLTKGDRKDASRWIEAQRAKIEGMSL